MEILFTILVSLVLLKGLVGAIEGICYHRDIRTHLASRLPNWTPRASVILPCKGMEHDLDKNVEALLKQNYPSYELLLVTATAADPALPLLRQLAARFPELHTKIVTAGISQERGEKVHNLIQAISNADPSSEVFVFTDSDCRPHRNWLRDLVAPLQNEHIGVSTGYRWYFPSRQNFAGVLRSVWNGSIATLLGNHNRNFAWGGSMAIRRSAFERANVLEHWKHTISDDYSMTQAMRKSKFRVHYEPRCLIGSYGQCGWSELLEWSTRQMIITKIYSRKLWKLALVSQWTFVLVWWWAVVRWAQAVWHQFSPASMFNSANAGHLLRYSLMVGFVFLLGAFRGLYRIQTIKLIHPDRRPDINRFWWGYVLLFPLASTLTAYNLFVSVFTSALEWRGVRYELQSPIQVRVIRDDSRSLGFQKSLP